MEADFQYDVFLSHSSQDKDVVRTIARRLQADGVRVWFDEWAIQPGDSIPAKIEDGLERSRVLVLCMSDAAFGSDWAQLEGHTFRFRDPLNHNRSFIPLRLDDADIKGALAQFRYIDWRAEARGQAYDQLLTACKPQADKQLPDSTSLNDHEPEPPLLSLGHTAAVRSVALSSDGIRAISGSADLTVRLWDIENGHALRVMEGHTAEVNCVALSLDGQYALSGSADRTLRLWDVESGYTLRVLEGHTDSVMSVAFSSDGRWIISGSADRTLRLWDVESGRTLRVLEGHTDSVMSVAFNTGYHVISGSADGTVRLWDVKNGHMLRLLKSYGYASAVRSVAISSDGRRVVSGSDATIRLWDMENGRTLWVLAGHTASVWSVALSTDGSRALSSSADHTLRLWDMESGRTLRVLEGHTANIFGVALSADGSRALSGSADKTVRLWDVESGRMLRVMEGHTDCMSSMVFSTDGSRALTSSYDKTARLWDLENRCMLRAMEGHTNRVDSAALSVDGSRALTSSYDRTVRLWDVESGRTLQVLEGHTDIVRSVVFSDDARWALSGSEDRTVRLWDVKSGRTLRVLEGHTDIVWSVALSSDGNYALSGSLDKTMRLWDLKSGRTLRILEGHTSNVLSVAFSADGRYALSGSEDKTVRLWDVESGRMLRVMEGHTGVVLRVALSADGRRALSGSKDKTVRLWDVESGRMLQVMEGHTDTILSVAFSVNGTHCYSLGRNGVLRVWPLLSVAISPTKVNQVEYTNAKVLLVGNSGVGKTGLSNRLALNEYRETDSTVGAWATQWKLPIEADEITEDWAIEREIWLWDFGGQADQRLIHQLYMDQTQVAALVFDPQKPELLEGLRTWDRDLMRAATGAFRKVLVAGRVDTGGLRSVSRQQIEEFAREHGFAQYIETSAKENRGCAELREAICALIDWEGIAKRTTPTLFRRLKEEIVALKDGGRVLMRFNELRETLTLRLGGARFSDAELHTVISLLAGPGVVWELGFGSWVLLAPEYINAYAQAVIRTIQEDDRELGCITEEAVLAGKLSYPRDLQRLPEAEERILLLAMHRLLVENSLCLSEPTATGTLLIFPSYARRQRPDLIKHPSVVVSYQFEGFLDDIYATLVVRLHRTSPFETKELWNDAADFTTMIGQKLGVKLSRNAAGKGELLVYFDPGIPIGERMIFSKYVQEHLFRKVRDREQVKRLRHWICPHCHEPVANRERAMQRLHDNGAKAKIICVNREQYVGLWDEMEAAFADPELLQRVRSLEAEADRALENESNVRSLVGDVISTVTLADQIAREFPVSNYGIDMEIEFKDDAGVATGKRLLLVLASVNANVTKHKGNESDVIITVKQEQFQYWMKQAQPVMWVVRNPNGEIQWMDIREALRLLTANITDPIHQISFAGERFDVMSVRRWREKLLPVTLQALYEALLAAFTSKAELKRLVRFGLEQNLDEIVADGSLQDIVFNLLQWVETRDAIPKLMRSAHRLNPSNAKLAEIVERLEA